MHCISSAKAAEAPKPVNKTETEMNPKNAGAMLETIHAAMIDITSGKAAPANLEKFLQNFADFSLDFLKVLVVQGNVNENPGAYLKDCVFWHCILTRAI